MKWVSKSALLKLEVKEGVSSENRGIPFLMSLSSAWF